MSVFCAALLLAVASQAAPAPEADPAYLVNGVHGIGPVYTLGYPYGYGGVVTHGLHHFGKREAEPVTPVVSTPLVYGAHPFTAVNGVFPYTHGVVPAARTVVPAAHTVVPATHTVVPATHAAVVPATKAVTYKTYTPTVETNVVATNLPVPVSVGGYKSVAGDNGELKGAVHEVPAVFGAPALNTQVNEASQGSLTVGTSAVLTHTVGKPIVNEHTVHVPTVGVYAGHYGFGKREAEATADPYVVYGNVYGLGYGHGYGYGLHGYGHNYNYFG